MRRIGIILDYCESACAIGLRPQMCAILRLVPIADFSRVVFKSCDPPLTAARSHLVYLLERSLQSLRIVATYAMPSRRASDIRPWVAGMVRVGYAAKGVIYLLIGAFAFQLAIGHGGRLTDA